MGVIHSIDTIVNFVPQLPERAISKLGDGKGPGAIVLLPLIPLGYFAGCVGQGLAIGYGVAQAGGTPSQAIWSGFAGAVVPPFARTLGVYVKMFE